MTRSELRQRFVTEVAGQLLHITASKIPTVHKHKCAKCETVWEHRRPAADVPAAEYHAAHNCPKCGANQRTVYYTEEERAKRIAELTGLRELLYGYVDSIGRSGEADVERPARPVAGSSTDLAAHGG